MRCKVCGCTDDSACATSVGPCFWIKPGLCSACAPRALERGMTLYTVYDHAPDGPFVVRPFHVLKGAPDPVPGLVACICSSLAEARAGLAGKILFASSPDDDPAIVETWT